MLSFTKRNQIFADLSQNSSPENITRASYLANIEDKYLMQNFFANEGSYSVNTIGATQLTLASAVPINSTSVTLASAWPYQTMQALLTFADGENVLGQFTNGSTSVTWTPSTQGLVYGITTTLAAGATTATLQTAWPNLSGSFLTSFSDGSTKSVTYVANSTAISWTGGLAGAQTNQIYTSTIASGSIASIGGVQFYPFPPNYSKLKDLTITVGVLKWTLTEVRTREEWDNLNVFPYYASVPSKFFIYPGGDKGGQVGIWPIPSTTGNVLTYNYKFRVPDLSLSDYGSLAYTSLVGNLQIGDTIAAGAASGVIDSYTASNIALSSVSGTFAAGAFTTGNGATGTISSVATIAITSGSMAVTGTGTAFIPTVNQQLESRWIKFSQPTGDGLWYQIQNISSTTGITLYQPYQGSTITAATGFTIGQMPLIAEDFQDMSLWKILQQYYTSIVDDKGQVAEFKDMYDRKTLLLKEYSGSNTINVNLSHRGRAQNPNIFGQRFGHTP